MREQIAKMDCKRCGARSSIKYKPCSLGYVLGTCPGYYNFTNQVVSRLREEIEKLKPLSDEEIEQVSKKSFPDSSTISLNTMHPRILMLCREIAQAQRDYDKKQLLDKIEAKEDLLKTLEGK